MKYLLLLTGLVLTILATIGAPRPANAQEPTAPSVLTLEQAQEIMLERNWDLRLARQALEDAAVYQTAARAAFIPALSVVGIYTMNQDEVTFDMPNPYAPLAPYLGAVAADHPDEVPPPSFLTDVVTEPMTIQFKHDYRMIATLTQPLLIPPSIPALDLANSAQDAAQAGVAYAEMELRGGIIQLFFAAARFQRFIEISERMVELAALQLNTATVTLEEGVGNELDLYRAEVGYSTAVRNLENARVAYNVTISAIGSLLNIEADFDIEQPPELPIPSSVAELTRMAVQSRPDIRLNDVMIDMAQERLMISRLGWAPILLAQFQTMAQRDSAFSGDIFVWSLSVTLSWTIFDGGFRIAEIQEQENNVVRTEIERGRLEHQIEGELEQAWLRLENLRIQVDNARAEAALANRAYQAALDARELGAATTIEVDLAQSQLYISELALADAEIQLQAEIYEIHRLAGQLE